MNPTVRASLFCGVVLVAVASAWTMVKVMRGDAALDRGDVRAALGWRPDNPEALMRLASERLAKGDAAGAETLARRLLTVAPADGRGYRLLAQVAAARGKPEQTAKLYAIAVRRSPRDIEARAWLAQRSLAAGDYATALQHVDRVLSMSAWPMKARLFPVLVQLSADPGFADALANVLASHPSWREKMLEALHDPANPTPRAADQVLAGLQRRGDLDPLAGQAWIESLIRQGRWGEAFARWASPYMADGRSLPLLFNGDFASETEGGGFDWRLPPVPGVMLSIEPEGRVGTLRLRFLGRRVEGASLASHALVLAPGKYRLAWRERMDSLRAATGIAWRVTCAGQTEPVAQADSDQGSRPWREKAFVFTVPATGCPAQWLQLAPTGNPGAGQVISGDVWFASMSVTRESKN